ncbi:MAG: nhaA [Phenylobacterium sp.]|nr:nhaA [Phenylobacterium sp.]
MARRITLDFLRTESAAGLILAAAAATALVMANSPWAHLYFGFVDAPFTIQVGAFQETRSALDWIKQGLMAVFFFVVGLQIKYEVLRGELANPRRLALPLLAALGGMVAPAAIYLALNAGAGGHPGAWPTPVATDIAFALAALAIAGPGLPPTLRVFLMTLAIADDLGAVAVIGVVFSQGLRLAALGGALVSLALMALLGRWRGAPYLFYALGLVLVWAFTLKSGISTSVAGVAAAMTIPIEPRKTHRPGVLEDFMESLHPYVAFLILPLFAFSAAGFSLSGLPAGSLLSPVSMGVALGLFLGKQAGVFGATAAAIGLKIARRPTGATWLELYGVSLLCGVGFTMSLFIGALAFPAGALAAEVRLGVLMGSLLSTAVGMTVLGWAQGMRRES